MTQAELSALRTQAIADAAEIERLKAQNAELLAAQEGTPCKHEFNAVLGGVLSCIHCYASFSEQQANVKKLDAVPYADMARMKEQDDEN